MTHGFLRPGTQALSTKAMLMKLTRSGLNLTATSTSLPHPGKFGVMLNLQAALEGSVSALKLAITPMLKLFLFKLQLKEQG
jgi:hypothetical protein